MQAIGDDCAIQTLPKGTTLGMELTDAKRDAMRLKFGDIAFDNIAKWAYLPTNLVLPHQHNSITIDFNAIETSRNFMVRYQYLLEGYDNDWNPITDKTTATFGNMNEGFYTFKLKAMSPEGVWCEPITYTFKVLPPWWRTWWFVKIAFDSIVYVESMENYVIVHTKDKKKATIRSTFSEFLASLPIGQFQKIHRSYAVQISLIDNIDNLEVVVAGQKILMSAPYRAGLFAALGIK